MTLNDLKWPFYITSLFMLVWWAWESVAFKDNCVHTDKNRPMLSASYMLSRDSSFWRYKVYADIYRGSLERRHFSALSVVISLEFLETCPSYYSIVSHWFSTDSGRDERSWLTWNGRFTLNFVVEPCTSILSSLLSETFAGKPIK